MVIAVVETHGREATAALVGDLEQVPRQKVEYRGVVLEEMDLGAVLARKPTVALVDELAHTNAREAKTSSVTRMSRNCCARGSM